MRDQLISFSERRNSTLTMAETDFPPLCTADFDFLPISELEELFHVAGRDTV